jgi:hypothetical protein
MDGECLALAAVVLVLVVTSSRADAENRHVFLNWKVSYAVRAPLGVAKRVITINGRFPGPLLNLTTKRRQQPRRAVPPHMVRAFVRSVAHTPRACCNLLLAGSE